MGRHRSPSEPEPGGRSARNAEPRQSDARQMVSWTADRDGATTATAATRGLRSASGEFARASARRWRSPIGVPDRARHDGRGAGAGDALVAGADPAGGGELPDLRDAGWSASTSRRWPRSRRRPRRSTPTSASSRGRRPTRSSPPPTAVVAGAYDDQFPIDVFQTGSGTSSNMNVNEVIATLAERDARRAGAPERPCQRVAVVQRRVPVVDPPGRDRGAGAAT